MSRYDSNPFDEEEVNPFAVSFALLYTRSFEFRLWNLILWIRECIGLWIRRILLLFFFLLKLFVDLDFVIRSGAVLKFLIRNVIQNFK